MMASIGNMNTKIQCSVFEINVICRVSGEEESSLYMTSRII